MAEKKPNIHKTILILLVVFIPPFWLLFTDEGARVSDTALLWLLGEDEIRISLKDLDDRFSEQDIRTVYSDTEWQCGTQRTAFGDALCAAQIGTFNGFPARVATFFFRDGRVSAFKLIYRDPYHRQIMGYYIGELGQPNNVEAALADGPDAANVLEWDLGTGVILMKKELGNSDEPALFWLASRPDRP
ncbi:MAG: hypothetical protein QNJ91_07195 [Gammaproteobacteria bacterium]|nr:hypothetical protein [Gammaproteobacteria bacterium]